MTDRLHFHFSLSCIGEGNGNPLQCSCLENPRDGGDRKSTRLNSSHRLTSRMPSSAWPCNKAFSAQTMMSMFGLTVHQAHGLGFKNNKCKMNVKIKMFTKVNMFGNITQSLIGTLIIFVG